MAQTRITTPPPDLAIEARKLRKVYRRAEGQEEVLALDDIDLAIPRGSFFGLLGPNGAGKSTFINILAGLTVKTSGQAIIWGFDIDRRPRQSRAAIGVVPQELNMDAFFTPREMLEWQAGLYGLAPAERHTDEILALVGLSDKADAYARSLSGGMKRRLLVAKAMVHAPPVLVLDEPTAGVDIELRHQLWDNIRALNASGVTVLLTTHYLEEAQQLCDRVAIINHGAVVACDETPKLIARLDRKEVAVSVAEELDGLPAAVARFAPEVQPYGRLVFRYRPSETQVAAILAAVQRAGYTILDLTTEESDLEDLFLSLTRPEAPPPA